MMTRGRPLGSAHAGTLEWMLQRLTALYLGLFVLFLAVRLAARAPATYEAWRAFWSPSALRLATLLFAISLLLHAWVGLRSVLRDYLPSSGVRFISELVVGAALLAQALWLLRILWL